MPRERNQEAHLSQLSSWTPTLKYTRREPTLRVLLRNYGSHPAEGWVWSIFQFFPLMICLSYLFYFFILFHFFLVAFFFVWVVGGDRHLDLLINSHPNRRKVTRG